MGELPLLHFVSKTCGLAANARDVLF